MAATTSSSSPSHPQPTQNDVVQPPQTQDPNPNQPQTLDLPNPPQLIPDPDPIILPDDSTENPPPPSVTSRVNKRKKTGNRNKTYKRKRPTKRVQNLTNVINPIPFVPKALDLDKHEDVLKRLGLYDFSRIELDRVIRTDLIVQLIVNYDPKRRCSYVNDLRINVNRADLARALKLPPGKQDRGSGGVEEVDLDSEVFSDEDIEFIEDFVGSWIVLRDGASVVPAEIANWTRCIKDGHPEKLDAASLIWFKVEKELTQGDKLVDCYYASHLQWLIRSQRPVEFKEEDGDEEDGEENVIVDEEKEENEEKVIADEEKEENEEKEEKEEETMEKEEENDENGRKDEKEVEEENVCVVQEQNIELNLGTVVQEIGDEEVTKDDETMEDAEEGNEEMEEQVDFKNVLGDHFLQRCQSSDLNNFEEVKVQEVEDEEQDEQVEHVEDEDEEEEEEEVEEEEEGGERLDEGFDMEANDDSFDRDGLTDNFLQGVEASHNPYNSHGMSSMDLFGSRDGPFMSHAGPSFYNNGGKRVMEPEEDIHHLDQNSKRLKTDEIWDQKQNDIGYCFDQMQQLMQKAKMIHESKERSYENLQYSQQMAMDQLQERQQFMEVVIKSKDEELEKKHAEVFRLERELYLMGDLLAGYRKALNDTRFKFSEYRKRFALKEEPLYKDAGPGGLVLSTREIEKQRLKQEEDMMKFQMLAKNIEEQYVYHLELQSNRLSPMVDKLVFIENEVQRLKEVATQSKETRAEPIAELEPSVETQKLVDENEASVEPEKNQKLMDEDLSSVEPEKNQKLMDEDQSFVEPEKNQKSKDEDESSVEPEKNQKPVDEDETFVEPEKNQNSMDEDESLDEPEKNQKPVDEDETFVEPEKNQNSMDEDEALVEPEKNQNSMDEDEALVEPEKNQNSMDEDESLVEPEKNQKSMDEDESCVEPEKNQKSPDEIPENDASMEDVRPDESEEKKDGEED